MDTGATVDPARFPLRATVDSIIAEWLAAHPRTGYGLVVAHTHGHGDHIAGDVQFADRPDTEVVGAGAAAGCGFFGFTGDGGPANVDLGGSVLEAIHTPGHQDAAITIFDPWTGWLLTGDTVYRGRLYVEDMASFTASLDRMLALARTREATSVMGCHLEPQLVDHRQCGVASARQIYLEPRRIRTQRTRNPNLGNPALWRFHEFLLHQ